MARWVKALAARSDELSSTPGTHMVGDNSLPFWFFFPTLSIQNDIEAKEFPRLYWNTCDSLILEVVYVRW